MTSGTGMIFADTTPEAANPQLVGHKFARQASLRGAGYRVPEFVCLSVAAFDKMMAGTDIPEVTDGDPARLAAWAEQASGAVVRAGVPEELAASLLTHFDRLVGEDGVVAVRSCTVATDDGGGEDSAADPFAGLGSSFLQVPRDELIAKVSACWASAFTTEGVLYRSARGGDPAAPRMAVGIQRMVTADRSFVVFSRDPRGGADDGTCLVAAAYGLGEGVVQEQADIDHFEVDRGTTRPVVSHIAHKRRQVVPAESGGTVVGPVPGERADRPVLDESTARQVADLEISLEQHFGEAQDVEGAITASGEIYLLQARPIVFTTDRPTARELHWSNGNISESYAGVTSVLTHSVAAELYAVGLEGLYRSLGVPERTLRHDRYELRRLVAHLDGRVYMRLESWYRLHGHARAFAALRRQWEKAVVTASTSATPAEPGILRRGAATAREAPAALVRRLRHPARMARFFAWWETRREGLPDPADRSPAQIVDDYRELWADVALHWGGTLVNNTYVLAEFGRAERLMGRWAPDADRGVLNGMLCDGPTNRSVLAIRSLIELGEAVGAHPEARDAVLGDTGPREVWRRLSGAEFGAPLAELALRHVRRYGYRGLHDLKIETPVIAQRPHLLVDQVRSVVRSGRTVADSVEEERRVRRQAEDALRSAVRNPVRRAILLRTLASLRGRLRVREDLRFCRTELMGVTRRMVLALAEHLVAAGQLDAVEDVHHLTIDELLGVYEGATAGVEVKALVGLRAAASRSAADRADPPGVFATDADLPVGAALPRAPVGGDGAVPVLTGLASSGGRVRGRARVVTDPQTDPESCRGRILVARETDPGWLYLMLAAKGLVAERGTVLSHTAITGRIFGIPTVVAVAGAVQHIPDGAWIEVDADLGTVTVLEGPDEGDEVAAP